MENLTISINRNSPLKDAEYTIVARDYREATARFNKAWKRLVDPTIWHELCATFNIKFNKDKHYSGAYTPAKANDVYNIEVVERDITMNKGHKVVVKNILKNTIPGREEESCTLVLHADHEASMNNDIIDILEDQCSIILSVKRQGNIVTALYQAVNGLVLEDDSFSDTMVAKSSVALISSKKWAALVEAFLVENYWHGNII